MLSEIKNDFLSKQECKIWSRGYQTLFMQLSTKFQLLIKTKIPKNKEFLAFNLSDVVFIMLINVKMPTIFGILTFMSRLISCSAELSMKKVL